FLITMATIVIASWRVPKLHTVRAIRDIPEPIPHRSTRRQVAAGATIAVLGAVGFVVALLRENLLLQDLGPVGLAFGVAVLTMRALPARAVFTAAGAFIVGWVLSPWKFFSIANADITLFIAAGLMLVLGGLLVVLFNSDSILAVATRLVRRRTWRPVVRTAFAAYNATSTNVTENHGIAQARVRIASNANLSGIQHNSSLIGVPANWIPEFPLQARALDYADDEAAWTALQSDPSLAIIDGTVVPNNFGPNFGSFSAVLGDVFHFRNMTGATRCVRIIGILYEQFAQGLWVSSASVKVDFGIDAASLFYF